MPPGDASRANGPAADLRAWLGALSIALAALLVYREQLGFYFTDVDTFALIATARVHSLHDLLTVVSSPLMQGQMENALFYRPLTSLTWGLDERIWGLDPFGYHLTDLCLHVVNSLVLYRLLLLAASLRASGALATRGRLEAWIAALLFAIHPITMETVPAIARRPDLLFCLFQLLTLTSIARHLRHPRARHLVTAALCCSLGLASKDSAVLIPAVAGVFTLCFSAESTLRGRLVDAVRRCWPLAVATSLFAIQRIAVLGGIGGYVNAMVTPIESVMKSSFATYMCVIVLPGDLDACQMPLFPLFGACVVVILACVAWLFRDPSEAASRRIWFAALGLTAYFALYTATRTTALTRTMYSLVPFLCIPPAWGVVEAAGWLAARWRLDVLAESPPRGAGAIDRTVRALFTVICALLVASIVRGAWSGRYLEEWRESGRVAEKVLASTSEAVHDLSEGSVVYLVDFPYKVHPRRPIMRERPILLGFSVQGWADLAFPEKRLDVIGLSSLTIDGRDTSEHEASVTFDPRLARLDITLGRGATASPQGRNAVYGKGSPLERAQYRAKDGDGGLVIDLHPEVLEEETVAFLVYVGDRVVLRHGDAWSATYSADSTL